MHIHKPKLFHGWGEFFKEYGIIVLGVLTALALEQAVEWLHWQHLVEDERATLNRQSENLYRAMLVRVDLQPCVETRLADIATILRRHDAGEPLGINGPVGRVISFYTSTSAFDMALADQSFSHMPTDTKEKYFNILSAYKLFRIMSDNELEPWRTLETLDRAWTFTPEEWVDVRKAYDRASDFNEVMKANLRMEMPDDWLFPFKGLATPKRAPILQYPWAKQLCQPRIVK